jgi:hypothetical protein
MPKMEGNLKTVFEMHELNIYPMRYASDEIRETLKHRGEMFWRCRKRCLISYRENENDAADQPVSLKFGYLRC